MLTAAKLHRLARLQTVVRPHARHARNSAQAASSGSSAASTVAASSLKFVDSHTHLDKQIERGSFRDYAHLAQFGPHFEACVHIACEPKHFAAGRQLAQQHASVFGAFGVHPHEASLYNDVVDRELRELMKLPKTVAWGECGLDYFRDLSPRAVQRSAFEKQMRGAMETKKPLIVHIRNAEDDALTVMRQTLDKQHRVHVHCFTGAPKQIEPLMAHFPNLFVGFTGLVCRADCRGSQVREALRAVPLARLLIETDGPYLHPTDPRGVCHPGLIPVIAAKFAEVKQVSLDEIYRACRENTRKCYNI